MIERTIGYQPCLALVRLHRSFRKSPISGAVTVGMLALTLALFTPPTVKPNASPSVATVPYYPQEKDYYCGPAAVQMALAYLGETAPSQDQLAGELETDQVKKTTYTGMMRAPFDRRGYTAVYIVQPMSLSELKEKSTQGYLVILLIWFEIPHTERHHYVVVVGCDGAGVLINDPWPRSWSRPGRDTGLGVYVGDSDLKYLWDCKPPYWALVVPYHRKGERVVTYTLTTTFTTRITHVSTREVYETVTRTETSAWHSTTIVTFTMQGPPPFVLILSQLWQKPVLTLVLYNEGGPGTVRLALDDSGRYIGYTDVPAPLSGQTTTYTLRIQEPTTGIVCAQIISTQGQSVTVTSHHVTGYTAKTTTTETSLRTRYFETSIEERMVTSALVGTRPATFFESPPQLVALVLLLAGGGGVGVATIIALRRPPSKRPRVWTPGRPIGFREKKSYLGYRWEKPAPPPRTYEIPPPIGPGGQPIGGLGIHVSCRNCGSVFPPGVKICDRCGSLIR